MSKTVYEIMVEAMVREHHKMLEGTEDVPVLEACGRMLREALDQVDPATTVRTLRSSALMRKAKVILFKPSGKYYTEEEWGVPADAIGPYDMIRSPGFRRIDGGAVLVPDQEPWGYPHLFPKEG